MTAAVLKNKTHNCLTFIHPKRRYVSFYFSAVNTDELVHTARSSSACFPVFQCTLSAA